MFDIFITSSEKIDVENIFANESQYGGVVFKENTLHLCGYKINYLIKTRDELSIATMNGWTLLIYGKVFPRFGHEDLSDGFLDAIQLIELIINDKMFYQKIKGHFVLFCFKDEDSTLEIYTDHFGYRPIYLGIIDGELIISSNLNLIRKFCKEINERVFFEKLLFTFNITDETFIRGFSQCSSGTKVVIQNGKLKKEHIFDLEDFVFGSKSNKFDLTEFISILNSSVRVRSARNEAFTSVTGGFDGRVILSSLLRQRIIPKTYSFGKTGGENTVIPLLINNSVPINYSPIYLGEEFEYNFTKYAIDSLYFSDGMSTFERANYCYAYNKLSNRTNNIITGLIGGEVFGPVSQMHDYMNPLYYDKVFSNRKNANTSLYTSETNPFYNQDKLGNVSPEISEIILDRKERYSKYKHSENSYLTYLYDLITVGFKKFYGSELHLTRIYFENLTPMFDIDVIEYLINSTHKSIYRNSFKSYNINRWQNRLLHAQIIFENYPELAYLKVDRGFAPIELIKKTKRLKAIVSYLTQKKSRDMQTPDFDSSYWVKLFYEDMNTELRNFESVFFNGTKIKEYMNSFSVSSYNRNANSALSLFLWEVLFRS